MTIMISKDQNIGTTFTGLVMTAFNLKDKRDVKIDCYMQYGTAGTIEVKGVGYDWFARGDVIEFMEAA